MAQSLAKIILHVVFSTKDREPLIHDAIEADLHAYIAGVIRELGCECFRVGGTNDHVHIACSLSRTVTVSKLLEAVKAASSKWMKEQGDEYNSFSWQGGYGVFSLSESQLAALLKYIDLQHEHHVTLNFKEELIKLFEQYNVSYDERYLWG